MKPSVTPAAPPNTHVVVLVKMIGVSAPPIINVHVNATAPPPRKPISWAWLRLFVGNVWHWLGVAWHALVALVA